MEILILHNRVGEEAAPDERDVLDQVAAVSRSLGELGHGVRTMEFDLDLERAARELRSAAPALVFNLVESVAGKGSLVHLAPALLSSLGIPYTGAPVEGVFLTSNKVLAKEAMRRGGLPTPPWLALAASGSRPREGEPAPRVAAVSPPGEAEPPAAGPWIVKSVWEHASCGLDDGSVVPAAAAARLPEILDERRAGLGGECFAEAFVDGREFNLALLAGAGGAQVLPPAEMRFLGFAEGRPRMVGYRAKWDEGSAEYRGTVRGFDFPAADRPLLEELARLARRCWRLFGLRGYARVDFRVDGQGGPWILEVNANPCLSPDAGFSAAVAQAGMTFTAAVARIVGDALATPAASPGEAPTIHPASGDDPTPRAPSSSPSEKRRSAAREIAPAAEGVEAARAATAEITFREEVRPADAARVRAIVESTGFFSAEEAEVAVELVEEALAKGAASGYRFLFAEAGGEVRGYACFGPIACTAASYDLYWIAVDAQEQGRGLGRRLLAASERLIAAAGGSRIYLETSSRAQYEPTRAFYLKGDYRVEVVLADFYAPGDGKVILVKEV